MFTTLLLLMVLIGCVYWGVAWYVLGDFFDGVEGSSPPDYTPPVSILKPVKGLDAGMYENFASFCRQDYPNYELLFGFADASDPAIAVVHRLRREFPGRSIRIIINGESAANPKTALLHHLQEHANASVLVINDSDIRVTSQYLRRVVAPLKDPAVGLVTCLYRSESVHSLADRLESLYMDATFLPHALVANKLVGAHFAMGSTMVIRRGDLDALGGFAAFHDGALDDYQLGIRVGAMGRKIHLADCVVANVLGSFTFRHQWQCEVRWMRSIRFIAPRNFYGLLPTFVIPWAALLALFGGLTPAVLIAFALALLSRWLVAGRVACRVGRTFTLREIALLPLRDMLTAIIWCAAATGQHVVWRNRYFHLKKGGRIQPASVPQPPLKTAICRVDAWLRRLHGIQEFSQDPRCLLRIGLSEAREDMALADGTFIARGQTIGELHFWNERIPRLAAGATLSWANEFRHRLRFSLRQLADHVRDDPRYQAVQVFHARIAFDARNGQAQLARMAGRFGFELIHPNRPPGGWGWITRFFEDIWLWALLWAFNPIGLRTARLIRPRYPVWISRRALLEHYAPSPRETGRLSLEPETHG